MPLPSSPLHPERRSAKDAQVPGIESGAESDLESLLRGLDRAESPAALRSLILAAYDRGERPAVALGKSGLGHLAKRGILLRLAPFAAAAAAAVVVGFVTLGVGGRGSGVPIDSDGDVRHGRPLASWRVIDDPTLGLAAGREHATSDTALAGLFEGP